jgi:hypothetical protein
VAAIITTYSFIQFIPNPLCGVITMGLSGLLLFYPAPFDGVGPVNITRYLPPTTPEAGHCIQECKETRNHCRELSVFEENNNQILDQAISETIIPAPLEEIRKKLGTTATQTVMALITIHCRASNSLLVNDIDQCFEMCGGSIERIILKG